MLGICVDTRSLSVENGSRCWSVNDEGRAYRNLTLALGKQRRSGQQDPYDAKSKPMQLGIAYEDGWQYFIVRTGTVQLAGQQDYLSFGIPRLIKIVLYQREFVMNPYE